MRSSTNPSNPAALSRFSWYRTSPPPDRLHPLPDAAHLPRVGHRHIRLDQHRHRGPDQVPGQQVTIRSNPMENPQVGMSWRSDRPISLSYRPPATGPLISGVDDLEHLPGTVAHPAHQRRVELSSSARTARPAGPGRTPPSPGPRPRRPAARARVGQPDHLQPVRAQPLCAGAPRPGPLRPRRWATDYSQSEMRASSFPFGQGIWNCLGEEFA